MSSIASIGTYLPLWGSEFERQIGPDEDAVTLAVAAGRAALAAGPAEVYRVVFITRDLPLMDGGNGAALLAGLGLSDDIPVIEQVGGAPDSLAAVADGSPGTLVIAADLAPAGAAAALLGSSGAELTSIGRVARSLPVRSRAQDGVTRDYEDPRLTRERGTGVALDELALPGKPDIVAGLAPKLAAPMCAGRSATLPTVGASSAIFALAALELGNSPALVLAVEQASAAVVTVVGVAQIHRDERSARPPLKTKFTPGDIAISLPAYDRAFEPKLRWEAGRCNACATLAFPPRYRCIECGSEDGWTLAPLPRSGAVYTSATVHFAVPGLPTPYSLAVVELDGVGVRALVKVTGAVAGSVSIDDRGTLVLRRVAVRQGVPDYGYGFLPDETRTDGANSEDVSA